MAGEINGTKVLLQKDGNTVVGQMDGTITIGGTPIEISNKSTDDFITYLNGELQGKQIVFTGTVTYNSDTEFRQMRADAMVGTQDTYSIVFNGSGSTTDESFTGTFTPSGISDNLAMGERVTTSITVSSSGAYTYVPAA